MQCHPLASSPCRVVAAAKSPRRLQTSPLPTAAWTQTRSIEALPLDQGTTDEQTKTMVMVFRSWACQHTYTLCLARGLTAVWVLRADRQNGARAIHAIGCNLVVELLKEIRTSCHHVIRSLAYLGDNYHTA